MDEYKNSASGSDGLPPPYSSPEHQASAAASAGAIPMTYIRIFADIMMMIMMTTAPAITAPPTTTIMINNNNTTH